MEKVKDIKLESSGSVDELIKQLKSSGGFTAKKLGVAADILEEMNKEECFKFLSFPACIISTGTRGIIKDLVKNELVDCLITTCGTIDYDLAKIWKPYYHGSFQADDSELRDKGMNRIGNVFAPDESYGLILEEKVLPMMEEIYKEGKEFSTRDLLWKIGEKLEDVKNKESSIIYWAYKNEIPIFLPGPLDGSFGSQLWTFWQDHQDFNLNLFEDEQALSKIVFENENKGALIIGGGISKHHTIWWNQFTNGLDYAIYLTTAVEWDGSLSGARTKEAISWKKLKKSAKHVTVEGDATILLPLLVSSLLERLKWKS